MGSVVRTGVGPGVGTGVRVGIGEYVGVKGIGSGLSFITVQNCKLSV